MRQVRWAHLGFVGIAVGAAAATYFAAKPFDSHSDAARVTAPAAKTARPRTTRRAEGMTRPAAEPADPLVASTPPEPRVPRGLTTTIVARLVERTFGAGGVHVKHVTCMAGAPGSGRFGCAYTRGSKCFAALVDMSNGSVNFASEVKLRLPLARCTAHNAYPVTG